MTDADDDTRYEIFVSSFSMNESPTLDGDEYTDLTRAEAMEICEDDETAYNTCSEETAAEMSKKYGDKWFFGFRRI